MKSDGYLFCLFKTQLYGIIYLRSARYYEKMPDSEQEQQIYKYVLENGSITIVETVKILDVKHRRARAVLLNICFSCKKKCEENGK